MESPLYHYNSLFDPLELIEKNAELNLKASEKYLTNFIGLKIAPDYMPECVRNRVGTVEAPPIPANWHTDISELGAALRSIELTKQQRFVMGELGCGWGCWMGITGLVAKKKGLDVMLYGVEGDKKHISWAKENMNNNGFSEKEYAIVEGIASAKTGKALFPLADKETIHYGLEPIFNASDLEIQKALKNKSHEILPMVSLYEIFGSKQRIDLLHIDIQGGEVDLVAGSIDYLMRHVAYLVIGTHSRIIEGKLIDILIKRGWILEIERPAIFGIYGNKLQTKIDGVQGWRNTELIPDPQKINVWLRENELQTKFLGWSYEESTHRWSEGESCIIEFNNSEHTEEVGTICLKGYSNGEQKMSIILNDILINEMNLTGSQQEIRIILPKGVLKTGLNKLVFITPDACCPGNGDSRKLGFAVESIQIEENRSQQN